jgi:ribonuclease J
MTPNKPKRKFFRPQPKPARERHAVHEEAKQYRSPVAPKGKLRVIPLGGMEEVGRNCIVFEYENDIVIIDMGLQFAEEDMPGVDYSIPNISYLKGKEKNIRAIIITHGHYDHTGGIPHLIDKLGNPPIIGTDLTLALIVKKQEDINPRTKLRLHKVTTRDTVRLGAFKAKFLGLSHNIPASMGVILETPLGTVLHTGDFKIDPDAEDKNNTELERIKDFRKMNLLALLSDSTNANRSGKMFTEKEIEKNLEPLFTQAKGRMIVATFASLLSRTQQLIRLAERNNRKVLVEGFSLKTNIEIGKQLGYIKAQKGTLIAWEEAKQLPNNRLLILSTGAQGEDRAVLMRIANREHKYLKIEKDDLVVFSSSVVPGNERSVQRLKDGLYREGAEVVDTQMMDIHASGHAKSEDLRWFIGQVHPRFFIPIEGNHSFLKIHGKLAMQEGVPKENVLIPDNGQVIEFAKNAGGDVEGRVTNERVPVDHIFVDGLGVGDISHIVLRDRQQLAGDGMVVVIATVDQKTGHLLGNPDIITRGFISVKTNAHLMNELSRTVKNAMEDHEPRTGADAGDLQKKIRNNLERVIFTKTQRQPMILPVIIEV